MTNTKLMDVRADILDEAKQELDFRGIDRNAFPFLDAAEETALWQANGRESRPAVCSCSRSRFKAIFFDLDGTLMETIPGICDSYQMSFRDFKLPVPSDAHVMKDIGRPLQTVIQEQVPANKRDAFRQTYRSYNQAMLKLGSPIFWPARNLIRDLTALRVPMGIVSSKGRTAVEINLESFGASDSFLLRLTAEDTTEHKPSPQPLILAKARMEAILGRPLAFSECAYVGDSVYDVASATAAGMTAAVVAWTHMPVSCLRRGGDFLLVRSVRDLLADNG